MRVIDRVRIPALVITAEDDPFVPVGAVSRPPCHGANPHIDLRISAHGGHCGFVGTVLRTQRRLLAEIRSWNVSVVGR